MSIEDELSQGYQTTLLSTGKNTTLASKQPFISFARMVLKILHLLFCFTALFVSGTTQDGGAAKSRPGDIATKG